MKVPHALKLAALGLLLASSAYAESCNRGEGLYKHLDEQRVLTRVERACPAAQAAYADEERDGDEEVSWADWAFDSNRVPSFHFIDLLELLGIG